MDWASLGKVSKEEIEQEELTDEEEEYEEDYFLLDKLLNMLHDIREESPQDLKELYGLSNEDEISGAESILTQIIEQKGYEDDIDYMLTEFGSGFCEDYSGA